MAAPGGTLYAGAGTSSTGFSPTRLTVELVPPANLGFIRSAASYTLNSANDGTNWVEFNSALRANLRPPRNAIGIAGGNIDLWTSQAGYNQDIGLFVCDASAGSCLNFGNFDLMAWKESGGFAGTYSPNAAFVQATWPLLAGHNYVFALGWKPNVSAPAAVIWGAAGTGQTQFSTTTLTVEAI